MSLLRVARDRLRALWRPHRIHDEIDDELRFHLDMRTAENVRRGMTPDDARRDAARAFGHVASIKALAYDVRGGGWLESAWQDLRYALRGLRARPAFTAGVMLTLGLGIGANAVMFGIVDRLLVRPPAFLRDPSLVHRLYQSATYNGMLITQGATRFPRYLDFKRFTHSFSSIAAFATTDIPIGDGEAAREQPVTAASASYFDLFAMRPALGRFFTSDDDRGPIGAPVVVLGYDYWQSQYAGQLAALGQRVRVGRTLCTIIGVAPAGFNGVSDQGVPAMYLPITTFAWDRRGADIKPNYDYTKDYGWFWLELVVRRQPGVSVAAAGAELTQALRRSWEAEAAAGHEAPPGFERTQPHATIAPIQLARGPEAGPQAQVVVWITGVALIVLLVACANVANLLLARALSRRREIGLRLALGASRGRLARQLLTESLVLATLGGALGLAIAQWGGGVLRALFLSSDAGTAVLTDRRTLLFAFVATIAVACLTGIAPLAQAFRYRLAATLNAGGRDAGVRPSVARTSLLLVQATLSVMLLAGAGLFVRSLHNVRMTHLGFDVDPLIVLTENFRGTRLTHAEQLALERRLVDEANAIPGVVSATPSPSVPYDGFEGRGLWVPGVDSVMQRGTFFLQAGNADFFRTYGARVLRGRAFDDHDGPGAPRVMVVSEPMAAALWPGVDALGKCIRVGQETAPCTTVIGIAEEMRIHTPGAEARGLSEYTYSVPIAQYQDGPAGTIVVRVAGDAKDRAESVRRRLQHVMPGTAYLTAEPLRAIVDPKMRSWRTGATMFVAFASLALVLAGIGLYSVIAYGVAQRRQEIGVRIALGASRPHVVGLVVRGGLRLVIAGVTLGVVLALWSAQWVAPLLFQESPRDPVVYGSVAAVLVAVALVAAAMPALAASRVDPNIALRAD